MNNSFVTRHIGPRESDIKIMLSELDLSSLDELSTAVVPENLQLNSKLNLPPKLSEVETIKRLEEIAEKNSVFRSFIGMGYYGCG